MTRGRLVRIAIAGVLIGLHGAAHAQPAPTPAAPAPAATPANVIPATARQLITGVIADWSATTVTLRRFKRVDAGWRPDGEGWQGTIGKGAAWGSGLHGAGAPSGRSGAVKREGDGKSPAGAFALRGTYGYSPKPLTGATVSYTPVTEDWQCVDDAASSHYNQIVDRTRVAVDWTSAEAMRRSDELYRYVIDIAHNPTATPGAGSCIFFHVSRSRTAPTVGCTAMSAARMRSLIAQLDPSAVYVLLPAAEYDALAAAWQLPRR